MMIKDLRSRYDLSNTILAASWLMKHTNDMVAVDKYHLIIETATQDYYVVTGDWYRCSGTLQKTITGGKR